MSYGGDGATRPLLRDGVQRNSTETQQSGHAPRFGFMELTQNCNHANFCGYTFCISADFTLSFAKLPRPGDSEVNFAVFKSVTCYYQSNYSNIEVISLRVLPKDTTSELADLPSHYPFLMLNVKQESCDYQL